MARTYFAVVKCLVPPVATTHVLPTEPTSGRGRKHGTSVSAAFDRWFRYPAGFASDYVGLLLDYLDLDAGTVVDCFAGSGVTGTAARSRGLAFAGIEAHPLIAELAALKLNPLATGPQVNAMADEVVNEIKLTPNSATVLDDEPLLVQQSFEPEVLRELVALREAIASRVDDPASLYLKWALLSTLRDVARVKVGWPYQRPGVARTPRHRDAVARFHVRAKSIAQDLATLSSDAPPAQIVLGDSQRTESWELFSEAASASIASPPYLNNFDYADATRLELYFWGEVTNWRALTQNIRSDMLIATTQQTRVATSREAVEALSTNETVTSRLILELATTLTTARKAHGSRAKEYDRVLPSYFHGMSLILSNLERQLLPGAQALWLIGDSAPYGVYVDTPALIAGLASDTGLELEEDVTLRARGQRWRSNRDEQTPALAERLIVLRKPRAK